VYIQIAGVKLLPTDIELRRDTLAWIGVQEPATALAELFGDVTHGWLFSSEQVFYRAIRLLAARSELERQAGEYISRDLTGWRLHGDPRVADGTVKIAGQVYATAAALAAAPAIASLVAARATLVRPAVTRLVNDLAAGYAFDTWAALAVALGAWDGTGALPDAVRARREARHPKSVRGTWDPTVAVTSANLRACERLIENIWGACGATAEYLIGRVEDLGGDVRQENNFGIGPGEGQQLAQYLLTPVTRRTLINIGNETIHEFVIEKRPLDQRAILQQGYIFNYNAIWWAGLADELVSAPPEDREALTEARANYGPTSPVNLNQLGTNLTRLLAAPSLKSQAATEAWLELPFQPRAKPNKSVEPSFQVIEWSVNDPDAVRAAVSQRLGMTFDREWISQLVMYEIDEFWRRIQPVRAELREARLRKQAEEEAAEQAQKQATEKGGQKIEGADQVGNNDT
jgi:hypothetical protein